MRFKFPGEGFAQLFFLANHLSVITCLIGQKVLNYFDMVRQQIWVLIMNYDSSALKRSDTKVRASMLPNCALIRKSSINNLGISQKKHWQ